jgi:hypothetical protein
MRNSRTVDSLAGLIIAAGAATWLLLAYGGNPPLDRAVPAAVGQALAQESLSLLGAGGQITLIARDTEAFPQPAVDVLVKRFERDLRRAHVTLAATQRIQTDPLRPLEVPAGDFFEWIRRAPAGHVIVSLLGPPLLTSEQRSKLGVIKPKVVAFCPGSLGETIDLRELCAAGLLHAVVVARSPARPDGTPAPGVGPRTFDQLYRTLHAADLTAIPPADR